MAVTESQRKEATTVARPFIPSEYGFMAHTNPDGSHTLNVTATEYGGQISLIRYKTPIRITRFLKRKDFTKGKTKTRRVSNIHRAQRQVYRLMLQNWPQNPTQYVQMPVWATFTYPDSPYAKISNRRSHIRDMQRFQRLVRAKYGQDIRFIAVMELTQKQNVHWHIVIFNMPKYDSPRVLADMWVDMMDGKGVRCHPSAQEIKRVGFGYKNGRRNAKDIAGYLSKYLAKTFEDYDLVNAKMYLPSKGLSQPVTFTSPEKVFALIERVAFRYFVTYQSTELTLPHVGDCYSLILEPCT